MAEPQRQNWLPLLVALIGLSFTFLLWYGLEIDVKHKTHTLVSYYPTVALVLGICITFLLTAIARITQVAKRNAIIFKKMNEDLKKEIAERINAEETKQKLEVALLQGQKLQAMGTLAGGIAHDFNNILYAVIGYVEMAREDVGKDSLVYKNLGKVLEGAHRGQELISRILSFSRQQHHQFDIINLKITIEAALALLTPTIPASVIIQFEPIDIYILANQTQIHQVLVNLINNSVDALDGEGYIKIKISRVLSNDPYLKQFPEMTAQNYCKLELTDSGRGMDQQTLERAFEPFFTTKEVGKGTGLGLSIVHTIIKEHQGQIDVSSKLGHGTHITILLPEYAM